MASHQERTSLSFARASARAGKRGHAFDIGVIKAEVLNPKPDEHIGSLCSSSTDTVY